MALKILNYFALEKENAKKPQQHDSRSKSNTKKKSKSHRSRSGSSASCVDRTSSHQLKKSRQVAGAASKSSVTGRSAARSPPTSHGSSRSRSSSERGRKRVGRNVKAKKTSDSSSSGLSNVSSRSSSRTSSSVDHHRRNECFGRKSTSGSSHVPSRSSLSGSTLRGSHGGHYLEASRHPTYSGKSGSHYYGNERDLYHQSGDYYAAGYSNESNRDRRTTHDTSKRGLTSQTVSKRDSLHYHESSRHYKHDTTIGSSTSLLPHSLSSTNHGLSNKSRTRSKSRNRRSLSPKNKPRNRSKSRSKSTSPRSSRLSKKSVKSSGSSSLRPQSPRSSSNRHSTSYKSGAAFAQPLSTTSSFSGTAATSAASVSSSYKQPLPSASLGAELQKVLGEKRKLNANSSASNSASITPTQTGAQDSPSANKKCKPDENVEAVKAANSTQVADESKSGSKQAITAATTEPNKQPVNDTKKVFNRLKLLFKT